MLHGFGLALFMSMEKGLSHSSAILGSHLEYLLPLNLADRYRPVDGNDHRWYKFLSDMTSWSLCGTQNRWRLEGSGRWRVPRSSTLLAGGEDAVSPKFWLDIVVGSLQQLNDRKPPFRHSIYLRFRAVHSWCTVTSQTTQVALMWFSRNPCLHLQNRIC